MRSGRRAGAFLVVGALAATMVGFGAEAPTVEMLEDTAQRLEAAQDTVEPRSWAIPGLAPQRARHTEPAPTTPTEGPPGVVLTVEEVPGDSTRPSPFRPAGVPLSEADVERLLAPLPPLPPAPDGAPDDGGPAWMPIDEASSRGSRAGEPLRVLGVFPSGDAEVAPEVTVVFSHPVPDLGPDDDQPSPFSWEPDVAGTWRWLDATTARFAPADGRLPGGSAYTLTIAGGLTGSGGVRLAEEVRSTIRIRGPLAMAGGPAEVIVGPSPVFLLGFDQRVDPDVVAAAARFRRDPDQAAQPEGDSLAEVLARAVPVEDAAPDLRRASESRPFVSVVALAPAGPLPRGASIRLELGPELTSSEGPLSTGRVQHLAFRTSSRFALAGSDCATRAAPCASGRGLRMTFSNPVDPEQPLVDRVRITPDVGEVQFRTDQRGHLWLYGEFRPWTSYEIRFDAELEDAFGAQLGQAETVEAHFERAPPVLSIPGAPFVSLDPRGEGRLEIPVRGIDRVRVDLYAPDLARWSEWLRSGTGARPWVQDRVRGLALVERFELTPDDGGRGFSFLEIPLRARLDRRRGPLVLRLTGMRDRMVGSGGTVGAADSLVVAAWVQDPGLDVVAFSDAEKLAVLVREADGAPAEGVRITLPEVDGAAVTGADGTATLPLTGTIGQAATVLVARHDGRSLLVPAGSMAGYFGQAGWQGRPGAPGLMWSASTDRPIYRPGEPLALRGWLREVVGETVRDLAPPEQARAVRYRVETYAQGARRERPEDQGTLTLGPGGGFDVVVELPDDLQPGSGRIHLQALDGEGEPLQGWEHSLSFRTRDFRRPEYEVTAGADSDVLVQGDSFEAWIEARYFDGPGLPASETVWTIAAWTASFRAPGWPEWQSGRSWASPVPAISTAEDPAVRLEATTDHNGRHRVAIAPTAFRAPFPIMVTASATVQDLSRQAGSATARVLVHPASVLPVIRLDGPVHGAGDPLRFEIARVDPEGMPHGVEGGALEVGVERLERRGWTAREPGSVIGRVEATCEPVELTDVPSPTRGIACEARPDEPGQWVVSVETTDDRGRVSRSEATFLATDRRRVAPGSGNFYAGTYGSWEQVRVEATVDERSDPATWRTGDTFVVRLEAPFPGARGVAVLDHHGIRRFEPVSFGPDELAHELRMILDGAPGRRVLEVMLESPDGRRRARAVEQVVVGRTERHLDLEIDVPAERVVPGSEVPVAVAVRDGAGRPVMGAEVTLWLVDEAMLFAGGRGSFPTEGLDPWDHLHMARGGVLHRGGLFVNRLPVRGTPGPGQLTGRVLDALTGEVPRSVEIVLEEPDGSEVRLVPDPFGELTASDLAEGELRITVLLPGGGRDTVSTRIVRRDAHEGVDLGTILITPKPPPQAGAEILLRGAARYEEHEAIQLTDFAARDGPSAIDIPAPPEAALQQEAAVREDFTPLTGFTPGLVTDVDGVVRTTVLLPGTVTRYRVFAVALEGRGNSGAADGLVVAGQDLVVRAQPPRFLRAGDRAEVSLLMQNGSAEAREIDVALRARGLVLEGTGGVRVRVEAGDRAEVRMPVRASDPGLARLQVRAVSERLSDAVATELPVAVPAAPDMLAYRTRLEPGHPRSVGLAPGVDAHAGWGGVEVSLGASALGTLSGELASLAGTTLPWPSLRIARVRGTTALERSLARDPTLLAALDTAALQRLRRTAEDDLAALRDGLRPLASDPTLVGLERATRSLGSWSVHHALEAMLAVEEAGRADMPTIRLAPYLDERLTWLRGRGRAPSDVDLHLAWIAHRTEATPSALRQTLQDELATVDTEGLRPLWLARLAAIVESGEGAADGPHLRYLEALENRAVVTAGGVTFRRGPLLPAGEAAPGLEGFHFHAGHPAEDAEVLLALMEVAPHHPLVSGLAATLAGPLALDGSGPSSEAFGPDVVGRTMVALAAWADVHEADAVDARVRVEVAGAGSGPIAVRTGSSAEVLTVPMAALRRDGEDEVTMLAEGRGRVHARVRFEWTPADPFQPAEVRGFAVRRSYEAIDDSTDVTRDAHGIWLIRAGARVRVVHELFLPARRIDVRLRDPLPAGLEPVQGTTGDEGAARAQGVESVQPVFGTLHPVLAGWRWYRESLFERDAFTAWASALPGGAYRGSYVARATAPGEFIVPGIRAWEAGRPDVRGRGEAHRVVVEVR